MVRIAVVDIDLCRPSKCNRECYRFCPGTKTGRKIIEFIEGRKHPLIHEDTCLGCGICIKKCPYNAITIVNLPDELERGCVHRYGPNGFKLYKLPIPKQGKVTGVIGKNGTGKTTSIRILAGEIKPNLGLIEQEPSWDEILRFFRGSELQTYFKKLVNGKIRVVHKIQYVDKVPRIVKGYVGKLLERVDERGLLKDIVDDLRLKPILDRKLSQLSGGELQKFLIAAVLAKDADLYLFDEPSSYLDVFERIRVARTIRNYTLKYGKSVIVVEHDLAVLDYLSDSIHVIFGVPGVYGIVSNPYGTGVGVNNFLEGFLPDLNMRIRSEPIKFRIKPPTTTWPSEKRILAWTKIVKKLNGFTLSVEEGYAHRGEIVGILGPNGIGKTTFIRILAGELQADEGTVYSFVKGEGVSVSYKPQYITQIFSEDNTVRNVLEKANREALTPGSWLHHDVIVSLGVNKLYDRYIGELSGGELQKVAIAACLIRNANIYLLDEPSAYLDVEERLAVAKAIKRVVEQREAVAFVVEHDLIIQDFLADTIMVFRGKPSIEGIALKPMNLRDAMNIFLKDLGITFRRDPRTYRPRVNKEGSYLDREQKRLNEYYYVSI
ncbi:MAG TPA: ribosome biogenesis/translation initiation ATPase RLI [Desulfurococcales archaeon]|nr:ribosome biogenesis/translation initiation ATPase RLI [Desulfurococcales archaeon]